MAVFLHPLGNASYKATSDVADHQRRGYSPNEPQWQHMHGVDLKVPQGTPVLAVTSGYISPNGLGFGPPKDDNPRHEGLRLHLAAADKSDVYFYAHLNQFAPGIKPGVWVEAGTVIGYTGRANGVDHLHFAVRNGDTDYILDHAVKISTAGEEGGKLYSDPDDGPMSVENGAHTAEQASGQNHGPAFNDGPMSIDPGTLHPDGPQSITQNYEPYDLNISPGNVNFSPGDFTGQHEGANQDFSVPDFGGAGHPADPGDIGQQPPVDLGVHDGEGFIPQPGDHIGDMAQGTPSHGDSHDAGGFVAPGNQDF